MHILHIPLNTKSMGEMNTESYGQGLPQTVVYMSKLGWDRQTMGRKGEVSREWRGCPEGYSSSEESLSKL